MDKTKKLLVKISLIMTALMIAVMGLGVLTPSPVKAVAYTAWSDQGIVYTAPAAGNAYYPCALYDLHEFGSAGLKYSMWYSDGNGAVFLVKSADGISWGAPTIMTGLGGNAHHVQVLYDANRFGLGASGPKYRMWFWDMGAPTIYSLSSMATAESVDGINWINKSAVTQNPAAKLIQDPDLGVGWNRGTYGPVSLSYRSLALNTGSDPWNYSFVMYYDGTDGSLEVTGLAYSADGVYWTACSAAPVLNVSANPAWDSNDSVYGTVYRDAAGFHYWYSGGVASPDDGIGYAFSTDGKTWVKNLNHIFHVSDGIAYRNERVCTPSVIDDGTGTLKMYYTAKATGGPKKIGRAIFTPDITINEYTSPVFSTLIPDQAYVIKDNVNYKLYYAGNDFVSINLAQSPDGVMWTPYIGNPIISDAQYHADVKYYSPGFPGANSGTNPSAMPMNYRIWYQGLDGHSIGGWRYSESPDGINWYNRLPVSQFGSAVFDGIHAGVHYGIADVVYTPGAPNTGTDWTFRIYANVQWEDAPYGGKELVVMAFSSDGHNWTGYDPTSVGYATPIFEGTLDGTSFDTDHIGWFKVIKNSPTDWQAFYSGGKDTTFQALNGIGYATSTDGINWTRRQTLFTTADGVAWRSQSVWMPSVVKAGNSYQVYFLGSDNPDIGGSDWIQWKLGGAVFTPDITPPVVSSAVPINTATGVGINSIMSATFSEPMDPLTITNVTFTLKQGVTPVSGTVIFSGATATFTPGANLAYSTVYTATITTGAKDLAGNALTNPYVWSFTTGKIPAPSQTAVSGTNTGEVPMFSATVLGQTSMRATNYAGALTSSMVASSKDGSLTIELARGTKVLRNGIRVPAIEAKQADSPPASNGLDVIVAYEFSPNGTVFNPAPRVTVKYDVDKLPQNTMGVALARYNDNSNSWEELPAEGVASIGGPVNGRVDHFSKIGVVAKLAPEKTITANPKDLHPKFIIDNLMISPAVINAGEVAKVMVSVGNDGNKEGTYPLILKMDGKQIASREVTLATGQGTATSFVIRDAAPGQHIIEVAEQKGSFKVDDGFNGIRDLCSQLLQSLKLQ